MPPLVCTHFHSQFFNTLQQFRESRYLCDVRLIADGEVEFPAHRLVLATSSPFFLDLFQSKKDTQDVTTVHLRNCSADCVQVLLQFLYSGELQLKQCDPGKVLSVARACRIGALEQMLASYATTDRSPSQIADSADESKPIVSPNHGQGVDNSQFECNVVSSASHSRKRKAKSSGGDQRQQHPVKMEPRNSGRVSKASTGQSEHGTTLSLSSPGSNGLDLPPVSTPSSIFMPNGPTLCPLHGVFGCGCAFLAMAAANGMDTGAHMGTSDPTMAATIQQLFFGAAAAAAAAARAANLNGQHMPTSNTNLETDSSGMGLAKIAKSTKGQSQLPTVAQLGLAQSAAQNQAQSIGSNSPTATRSDQANQDDSAQDNQPRQEEQIALNLVQVPADDKEGWCRNKKYIKKTPQGYQCTVCKKTYGRYNSVSYHVTIYHRNPPIQCDQPGCTFSTREARYIHFHKYYRHDVALPTNIDLESRRCPFCKHVAKSPAMLEKHINRHMPDCIRVGRTYHCELCKKELASRHALVQHMMVHENEKGLSCDQCSYRGRTAENLQQHKLFKHGSGDLWCAKVQCDECQFRAPSKSQLATHQRNVHGKKNDADIGDGSKGNSDTEGEGESGNGNQLCMVTDDEVKLGIEDEEECAMGAGEMEEDDN